MKLFTFFPPMTMFSKEKLTICVINKCGNPFGIFLKRCWISFLQFLRYKFFHRLLNQIRMILKQTASTDIYQINKTKQDTKNEQNFHFLIKSHSHVSSLYHFTCDVTDKLINNSNAVNARAKGSRLSLVVPWPTDSCRRCHIPWPTDSYGQSSVACNHIP